MDTSNLENKPVIQNPDVIDESQIVEPHRVTKVWKVLIIAILALLILLVGGYVTWNALKPTHPVATPVQISSKKIRIGISMDTIKELRWAKDIQYLQNDAKQRRASTTVLVADGDDATQILQIENLISQKVDVLIVVPHSSTAVAPAIKEAHDAGIKVISYDRLILGSFVDLYVSFNNEQVGKNSAQYVVNALPQGKIAKIAYVGGAPTDNNAGQIRTGVMSVLDPLIKAGKIVLVYDEPTINWLPDTAYNNLKTYLAKGNLVDGVVAANDGTAFGAIQALQEKGLAGKVPVTGQDADLPALQRIVEGTQTMTNYKSIKDLASRAIRAAIDLGNGKVSESNASLDNNMMLVKSYLLEPVPVTKDNIMQTVVKDGFMSEKDIYRK